MINYRNETVAEYVARYTQNAGFDVVFDTIGGDNLNLSFNAVAYNGQVVTILAAQTYDLSPLFFKGATLHTVMQPNPLLTGVGRERYSQILTEITRLVDSKTIKPFVDKQQFTFTSVAVAHSHLESGRAMGKVVIVNDL